MPPSATGENRLATLGSLTAVGANPAEVPASSSSGSLHIPVAPLNGSFLEGRLLIYNLSAQPGPQLDSSSASSVVTESSPEDGPVVSDLVDHQSWAAFLRTEPNILLIEARLIQALERGPSHLAVEMKECMTQLIYQEHSDSTQREARLQFVSTMADLIGGIFLMANPSSDMIADYLSIFIPTHFQSAMGDSHHFSLFIIQLKTLISKLSQRLEQNSDQIDATDRLVKEVILKLGVIVETRFPQASSQQMVAHACMYGTLGTLIHPLAGLYGGIGSVLDDRRNNQENSRFIRLLATVLVEHSSRINGLRRSEV